MVKAILFDAFGTLFRVTNGGSANKIRGYITENGHDVPEKEFFAEWKAYYKEKTASGQPFQKERELFAGRIRMFYERYGVERDARADSDAILDAAYERGVYPDVPEMLERLRGNYRIYIASNTDNDVLDAVMKRNGISADGVYTSENLRCYKPCPDFYKKILADIGLSAEEVVFVGDSMTDDVEGPQKLGIKAFLLTRTDK